MRSFAVVIITLTFALTLLTGCGGGGVEGAIRALGLVLDDGSLQPIQGARVVAGTNGVAGTTNVNGNFDVRGVPAGAVLTVTAANYLNTTVALGARTGDVDLGTIYLVPAPLADTGTVIGVVTQSGGAPAAGAAVRASDRQALTRANGAYRLYNVPTGFLRVFATAADESATGSKNVTVIAGFESIANIQLGLQPPPPP